MEKFDENGWRILIAALEKYAGPVFKNLFNRPSRIAGEALANILFLLTWWLKPLAQYVKRRMEK